MKELKFRVWNEDKNKFIPNGLIGISSGKFIDLKNGSVHFDSDDKVIEQFTGLRDRNGKDIYEGDILKIDDGECDFIGEVKYGKYEYYANGHYANGGSDVLDFADVSDKGMIDGEIIGNIHENGDLLK